CGRMLAKMSKIYEPSAGHFRSVRLPPLSSAELDKARRIIAAPAVSLNEGLFIGLEKKDSRSSSAPVDGNLDEAWVAGNTFTELIFPQGALARTLYLQVTEPLQEALDVHLATEDQVFRVEMPPSPALVYSVDLPEGSECVAVIQSDPPVPLSEVMVSVPA